jgi:probable rRNA maturation factor
MSIKFFNEQIDFLPEKPQVIQKWITSVIESKGYTAGTINYIFCDDEYLLTLNQRYLDHDTYTDIITFDYTIDKVISGDIFISVDRVQDNATQYKKTFENELQRVMIHGILHLCGQGDKSEAENNEMHAQEDLYLKLLEK